MNLHDLKSQVALGEDGRRQFKRYVTNVDSLARRWQPSPTLRGA